MGRDKSKRICKLLIKNFLFAFIKITFKDIKRKKKANNKFENSHLWNCTYTHIIMPIPDIFMCEGNIRESDCYCTIYLKNIH